MGDSDKQWLSVGDAAERLGVSQGTARNYADAGKVQVGDTEYPIRVTRLPGRHRRLRAEDVERVRQAIYESTQDDTTPPSEPTAD